MFGRRARSQTQRFSEKQVFSEEEVAEILKLAAELREKQFRDTTAGAKGTTRKQIKEIGESLGIDPDLIDIVFKTILAEENKKDAERIRTEKLKEAARRQREQRVSRAFGTIGATVKAVAGTALAAALLGWLVYSSLPLLSGTWAWWSEASYTPEYPTTIHGDWYHPSNVVSFEFLPDGRVLETYYSGGENKVSSGTYYTDYSHRTTFTIPDGNGGSMRGDVLSLSNQEMRVHFVYPTYVLGLSWWKAGDQESVITYERHYPKPWGAYLWMAALVIVSCIAGLFAGYIGSVVGERHVPGQGYATYGASMIILGIAGAIAFAAHYTGFVSVGAPLCLACLGFVLGLYSGLAKR